MRSSSLRSILDRRKILVPKYSGITVLSPLQATMSVFQDEKFDQHGLTEWDIAALSPL